MKHKPITPDMIISKAREYLGVPWVHQGRDKTKGVDCSGFVINIYEELTVKNCHGCRRITHEWLMAL